MRRRRGPLRFPAASALTAWVGALSLILSAAAWAQDSQLGIAIKATYLVKFAGFVEWPAGAFEAPSSPLNICIVGTALAGLADEAAARQSVGQHPLAVRHLPAAAPGASCHMLFTAGTPQQTIEAALDAVRREPVLTVTDLPATAEAKGIINMVLQAGRVRFQIDERAAAQAGLRISSQLLALAVNTGSR